MPEASDIRGGEMHRLSYVAAGLLLATLLLCGAVPSFAQQGGKKAAPELTERERLANTALFVDAVKERLNENYGLAEEMLHRVIVAEPSHDAAHYELAILMVMSGRMQEALQEVETAVSYNPENHWYKVMLGDLYNQTGQFRKAEACWRELSEKYPENLDYSNNYAYSLTQQNRLKEALKVYDAMQNQLGLNEQLCETKKNIWVYLKKPDAAVAELKPLMEAFPGEAKYFLEAAQVYFTFNKEKKGVAYLEAAQRIDSTNEKLQMTLYDYYAKHNRQKEAYACLRRIVANPAVPIEPKRKVLGGYYMLAQKDTSCYREINPMLDLLVKAHPQQPESWSLRADFMIQQQRFTDALSDLERVLALDSSKSIVWEYYITILLQMNRPVEAAKAGERASQLFPTQAIPYFAMAAGAMEEQDYEAAVANLQSALKYVSDNPAFVSDIYRMMARAYEAMGSYSKAEEAEARRAEYQRQADKKQKLKNPEPPK